MATVIERATVDPAYGRLRTTITQAATATLAQVLQGAQDAGEIDAHADLGAAIDQLAGPLAFRRLFLRRMVHREFVAQVADAVLAAHQAASPRGAPGEGSGRRAQGRATGPSSTQ